VNSAIGAAWSHRRLVAPRSRSLVKVPLPLALAAPLLIPRFTILGPGRNSPARSTVSELNSGEGVAFLVREVALKLKESPGPTQREWERVSGPVHGEWRQIRGVTGGQLTGAHKRVVVEDIVHRRGGPFYRGEHRDRWDRSGWRLALGYARTTRAGTRGHRHAARQTVAGDLPGNDAEGVLSVCRCPSHAGKGGRSGVHVARGRAPAHRT
jgi:hypothetical protein